MVRLKSVGVMSVAKISALLYGSLALLLVPFLFGMAAWVTITSEPTPNQPPATLYVVLGIVAPFIYAAMGFITGAAAALIYNLVAGWVGGLALHFEPVIPPQPGLSSIPFVS